MRYEPFRNLFVTPVLPFGDDGSIDEPAYRAFLRRFLTPEAEGAGMAVIANPEAGELFTLDREERQHVVRIVQEESGGRNPVLAGVVDVTTDGTVRTAKDAADLGVDGLFVFPPIGAGDITQSWDAEAYPEGAAHVLIGTDYPFDMGVTDPLSRLDAVPGLSGEERAAIAGGTAARLLRIEAVD